MRKTDLERALMAVPDFGAPRPELEQYRTPAGVAADLLWTAHEEGAIAGKTVLDLGCGTGLFALGAHLLGAARVIGVDVDATAVAAAQELVPGRFVVADVADWRPDEPVDTVLMNPPFGAQQRGADRPFYEAAAAAVRDRGGTVWFLAQPKTERFLVKEAHRLGGRLERVLEWPYPIEARFSFHRDEVASIDVACYEMSFGP